MAIKTAYKPKKSVENIPVEKDLAAIDENIPKVEINSEAQEPIAALSVEAEPAAAVAAINEATKVDDAALALKKQLDAVRQNEELQRQQAAMMAALQPPTREQLLDQWKKQGMSETEAAFLQKNPALIDNPRLT